MICPHPILYILRWCAVAVVAALYPAASPADEALVVLCQPRTVRGEPAGLHAVVFTETGSPSSVIARRFELPQTRLAQAMQPMFDARLVALLAQGTAREMLSPAGDSLRELVLFRTAPLERVVTPWTPGWEPVALLAEPSPVGDECRLILLERRNGAQAPPRGRVRVLGVHLREDNGPQLALRGQWDLHGAPAVGAIRWEGGQLYVVCEGPRAGTTAIVAIDLPSGEQRYIPVKAAQEDLRGSVPAALAILDGGMHVALLESAYSFERRDGGRTSTIRLLDAVTLRDSGASVGIAGAASRGAGVFAAPGGELVTSTVDDATGFAYVTAFAADDEGASKRGEWGFRDATSGPRVAVSPDDKRLAVAGGKSLLVLGPERGARAAYQTRDRIEAMAWAGGSLYVADGPRLRRIEEQSEALSLELARFDGFVVDMLEVPAAGESSAPNIGALRVPPRVVLDADTPGRDRRVLPIALPDGAKAELIYDERAAPWLNAVLEETTSPANPRVTLSLNLQRMHQPGEHLARVRLRISEEASRRPVVMSEELLEVVATSYAKGTRAVEWQSPTGFDAIAELLSGAPLHLSQRIRRGPIAQAPRGSAAVVVRLDDVARGAITRQVLLDYVSGGGGLLVIAGHSPAIAGEGLRRWLEPLGILIDSARDVSGKFAIPKTSFAAFGMDQLAIAAGAYVETTRPMEFAVPGEEPGTVTLAFTQHGYGRLAVLASGSPIEDAALSNPGNRRFARTLFGWLAGAHRGVRDSDNDGLRDDIEDADGNTERGPRETDWVNPDTDGDGVPDGVEDANLNALVDEGETDPRRADTDDDAIPDGADSDPLPPAGAPAILAVHPQGGPAEGGTFVELIGRNLPVNPQVWFGERRATVVFREDSTRVVAAAPPRIFSELTGPTGVRIADPLDVNEYVVKEAYTYRPPSAVELVLAPAARIQRAYDGYRGTIALSLDIPDVRIDFTSFYLRTDPPMDTMEGEFTVGQGLTQAGRELRVTRYGASEFHFVLGPGEPLTGPVEVGTFSWRLADALPDVTAIRWYVLYPDVRVLWGSNVDVPVNDVDVRLDKLDAQAAPARPPDPAAML